MENIPCTLHSSYSFSIFALHLSVEKEFYDIRLLVNVLAEDFIAAGMTFEEYVLREASQICFATQVNSAESN